MLHDILLKKDWHLPSSHNVYANVTWYFIEDRLTIMHKYLRGLDTVKHFISKLM
jgi:hypothetical protein